MHGLGLCVERVPWDEKKERGGRGGDGRDQATQRNRREQCLHYERGGEGKGQAGHTRFQVSVLVFIIDMTETADSPPAARPRWVQRQGSEMMEGLRERRAGSIRKLR